MPTAPDNPPSKRRRRLVLLAVSAGLLVAAASAWLLLRQPPAEDGLLQVNGRIEGDRVTVASKFAGRVSSWACAKAMS